MKSKFILLTGFILLLSIASISARDRVEKETIHKQFKTTGDTHLQIDNKYGDILIREWNQDEIEFTIEITGRGKNQKTAEEMVKRTSIKFDQSDNKVSATTSFLTSPNEKCKECSTSVNYVINVPTSTYLYLKNKYGDIRLDYVSKPLEIELEYGNMSAYRLEGDNNKISISYGTIELMKSGSMELNMKASKARIDQLPYLKLNGDRASLSSGMINNLQITTTKYGQFTLGKVDTVNFGFNTTCTRITIQQLGTKFEGTRLQYCTIEIDTISPNLSSIDIDAIRSDVTLGINQKHNAKIDLSAPYGNIALNGLKINKVAQNDNSEEPYIRQVIGYIGKRVNPKTKIKISTAYATIAFTNKITE